MTALGRLTRALAGLLLLVPVAAGSVGASAAFAAPAHATAALPTAVARPADVTSVVRIAVTGPYAADVRSIRLHSSTGIRMTASPGDVVSLLSRRSAVQHHVLRTYAVTWTVDSVTTAPRVAVMVERVPFDPFGQTAWTMRLIPVAGTVNVQTLPATAGVHLSIAGADATTAGDGTAVVDVADLNSATGVKLQTAQVGKPTSAAGAVSVAIQRVEKLKPTAPLQRRLMVALAVSQSTKLRFVGPDGQAVDITPLESVTLRENGIETVLRGPQLTAPVTLLHSTTSLSDGRWLVRPTTYSVTGARFDGGQAVFAGRQTFRPGSSDEWTIRLALYDTTVRLHDALFGTPVSTAVTVTGPSGVARRLTTDATGALSIGSMVRGTYVVHVLPAVVGADSRLLVSRSSVADIRVITVADAAAVGVAVLLIMIGLVVGGWLVRRRADRAGRPTRPGRSPRSAPSRVAAGRPVAESVAHRLTIGIAAAAITLVVAMILPARAPAVTLDSSATPTPSATPAPAATPSVAAHVPVYAYFYQWFTPASWRRAKQDFPLIGQYSSANPAVLRTQLAQAKSVGINGFITSWKDSPQLNHNLQMLIPQAKEAGLDLGVVYEALDFTRKPLPIETVRASMLSLVDRWGAGLRSRYFGKPFIIWTGTNNYTRAQVAEVHQALAGRALLLAASKSVSGYERLADDVDGEAYYWSSSNPTSPQTQAKLIAMSAAVHAHHGVWIAPAASGFDGTTLGHTRVIGRDGGKTLAASMDDAFGSNPDAVGVISWNEWSENTYIEPGKRYGSQELDTLKADLQRRGYVVAERTTPTSPIERSNAAEPAWPPLLVVEVFVGLGAVILVGAAVAVVVSALRRQRARSRP